MGCAITDLLAGKEIEIEDLKGKTLAVDAFNQLYMFISTIRQPDGSLLTDSKGKVTSHLSGLFFRFTKLLQQGLKFVFVFDGEVPKLKNKERERRKDLKILAQKKYEEASAEGNVEEMKKYAARTSKLTLDMLEEAKNLIHALGQPIIQAPSEGEAQAAELVKKGLCYAVMSQDADSLLFGTPVLVKNLSITKRKKQASKLAYEKINPVIINLRENLQILGLSQDQLIVLGILVGTDFNLGGIKGIGPKKALKLVKEYKNDFEALFKQAKWNEHFDYDWKEVFSIFKSMKIAEEIKLEWRQPDKDEIIRILVENHDFSQVRIEEALKNLTAADKAQKGLSDFF